MKDLLSCRRQARLSQARVIALGGPAGVHAAEDVNKTLSVRNLLINQSRKKHAPKEGISMHTALFSNFACPSLHFKAPFLLIG